MKNRLFIFISFIAIAIHITAAPLTVNGQDINEIATPDQFVSFSPTQDNHAIFIQLHNRELTIMPYIIEPESMAKFRHLYVELLNQKSSLAKMVAREKTLLLNSKNENIHKGAYLYSKEEIALKAGTLLKLQHAILVSNKITLETKQLEASSCYFPYHGEIKIKGNSEQSMIQEIIFNLPEREEPCFLQCKLDLESGSTEDPVICFGADEVGIRLHPDLFE